MPRGRSQKERLWYEDIKYHFIYLSYTYKDLAAKFPVSEKTVRTWAARDNWIEEKNQFLRDRMELSTTTIRFAIAEQNAIIELRKDDPNMEISQARYYAIARFTDLAMRAHDYAEKLKESAHKEDELVKGNEKTDGKVTEDTRKDIEQQLGIK